MRFLRVIICLALFGVSPHTPMVSRATPVFEVTVAVLKSENNAVYDQLLSDFKRACPAKIVAFSMEGNQQTGHDAVNRINQGSFNLMVAIGASAAIIAKEQSKIPVVFCGVFGIDKKKLTGNNITGITMDAPAKDQFSALKKLVPKLKTIGVIYNPKISEDLIREARIACTGLGLRLDARAVNSPKEVTGTVRDLTASADALWIIPDTTVANAENFRYMLLTCIENKVPLLAFSYTFVREGALVAISGPIEDVGGEVAAIANSLLGGQMISSIPISPPKKKILFLNLKTARSLGINVPSDVLASARLFGRES